MKSEPGRLGRLPRSPLFWQLYSFLSFHYLRAWKSAPLPFPPPQSPTRAVYVNSGVMFLLFCFCSSYIELWTESHAELALRALRLLLWLPGRITTLNVLRGFGSKRFALFSETRTFRGLAPVEHVNVPNPMIGPGALELVRLGALFTPCVREDFQMNARYILALDRSLVLGQSTELGCCQVTAINVAGTTSEVV